MYARGVPVRAIVFDVFGTLVDWRSGIGDAFRREGASGRAEQLADAWRARYAPSIIEINEGVRPWVDFDELHLLTLEAVLSEHSIGLDLEARHRLVAAWHQLDPWPDVRAGLDALRRDHITATLSNGHLGLLVDLARHANLNFDCLLSAELANAYKPAPVVYETAARLLRLQPAELMLVAAHPWDLAGARAAGLQTAFIDRPHEYGPGSPPREDPDATESSIDLRQLAARLAGSAATS